MPVFSRSVDYYDAVYSRKDYRGEAAKVAAIIARHKRSPGRDRLDVACGTGSHLLHLRRQFRCDGLDLDPAMLRVARKRLPGVRLYCADMRSFDLPRRYDAVICLFSSISYVRTLRGLDRALSTFSRHTTPGGVVVVEPWIFPATFQAPHVGMLTSAEGDVTVSRAHNSARRGRVATVDFDYLIVDGARVRHLKERHRLGLFSPHEYGEAFKRAGLGVRFYRRGLIGRGLFVGVKPHEQR